MDARVKPRVSGSPKRSNVPAVMAGLVPAIHVFSAAK
jgi:hypothetical protein